MPRNQYDLCNIQERKEFFHECVMRYAPSIKSKEFEENVEFLCSKDLSSEWLTVGCIAFPDNRIFTGSLNTGKKIGYTIELDYLFELARSLKAFGDERISHYIKKLNSKDFNKISVISEIIVTSKYIESGFEVDFEPGNKRIGKSGLEGKSDLAVKFRDERFYFEITQQELVIMSTYSSRISDVVTRIAEELKRGKLIPNDKKIDALIVNSNKVLSKGWSDRFLNQLKTSSLETNIWKYFDGIHYIVLEGKPDELIFGLRTNLTPIIKKQFRNTVKMEAKQIPAGAKGVIIINSSLNFGSFPVHVNYAKTVLNNQNFDNEILAIIVRDQYQPKIKYRIIPNNTVDYPMMNFLEIPFEHRI